MGYVEWAAGLIVALASALVVAVVAFVLGGLLLVVLLAAEPDGWEDDYELSDDDLGDGVLVTDVLARRDEQVQR